MYNLFLNSNVPNELPTHNEVFKRLLDICHQNQISSISCETGKLRTYSLIKSYIGYENYLSNVHNVKSRQRLTKFRLSNHDLMIEVGRYKKIPKSERFCPFFPSYVENEIHFLINCRTYNENRKTLFDSALKLKPNVSACTAQNKFTFLLSCENLCDKHGDLSHDLRKDNNFKLKLPLYGFDTGSVLVNAVL